MKRKRHSPEQIIHKLRQADAELAAGQPIAAICQKLGVAEATFHRWRNQYGGMKANDARRLKELERENARLKKLVADQAPDQAILKEAYREHTGPTNTEPDAPLCGSGNSLSVQEQSDATRHGAKGERKAGDGIRTHDVQLGNHDRPLPKTRKRRYQRGLRIASLFFPVVNCGRFRPRARCTPRCTAHFCSMTAVATGLPA